MLSSLLRLHEKKLLEKVYVLEGRPMTEGHRTIRDLNESGVHATLMIDAAIAVALADADIAIVGADSISADGYLLNKTGTFPLAISCKEFDIPLYVLSDSLKFSPQLRAQILVEDRPGDELLSRGETDTFAIWNRYFEWTSVDFVTEFITERGSYTPDQLSALVGEDHT